MKKKISLNTTAIIALGFLAVIAVGTLLLILPFSSASGESASFTDALFTSTTSVCVTGLVVVSTASYWSLFGKIVILFLIQIGGLGIISIMTAFLLLLRHRITLKDAVLLEDAMNLNRHRNIDAFLKKVLLGTFLVETAFALLYIPRFCLEFGAVGIWYALFHSVSTFCNAGIDIFSESSLAPYVGDVYLNVLTMLEIVLGGIGFIVWFDVLTCPRRRHLSLHSRLVLTTTAILIFGGAALFLLFEYNNPATIGELSFGNKVLASFFQAVTLRTAGFSTLSQVRMTTASDILSCLLMFIGGSPIGTAGGIKTTTVAVILLSSLCTVRGKANVTVGARRVAQDVVRKASAVLTVSLMVAVTAMILLAAVCPGTPEQIVYEVFSALGTVGVSKDLTAQLNTVGKWIIILCMYFGRIGPLSIAIVFSRRVAGEPVRYATEDVTVG